MISTIKFSRYLLLLLAVLNVLAVYAKPATDLRGCQLELASVYRQEESKMHSALLNGDGWLVQYTMVSDVLNPLKKKYETVTTKGSLIAGKHMRYMKTDMVEVYMDEDDVFTINASTKSIMRTTSTLLRSRSDQDIYGIFMKDSLFKNYKLMSCAEHIFRSGDSILKYDLVPIIGGKSKCSKISVYVDPAKDELRKIEMQMNPKYGRLVQSYTIIFEKEEKMKLDKSWERLQNKVIAGNGQVLPKYKGYTYQDLKSKKRK